MSVYKIKYQKGSDIYVTEIEAASKIDACACVHFYMSQGADVDILSIESEDDDEQY